MKNVNCQIVTLLGQVFMDVYISFVLGSITMKRCVVYLAVMKFVKLIREVGCINFVLRSIIMKRCVVYLAVMNCVTLIRVVGYISSVVMSILCVVTNMNIMEAMETSLTTQTASFYAHGKLFFCCQFIPVRKDYHIIKIIIINN